MDISVVVCTYNRAELLRSALESLVWQETDEKFTYEILVVDNGSTDGTCDVVNDFIKKTTKVHIRYVYEEESGIAVARNRGIKEVCCEWIAFFDDDQWADPHWLFELYKVAMQKEADCVGGAILLVLPDSANISLRPFIRSALREVLPSDEPQRYSEKIGLGPAVPPDFDVVDNTQVVKQADILKGPGDSQSGDKLRFFSADGVSGPFPGKQDFSTGWFFHPGHAVKQGGLPGSVRADHSDDLSKINIIGYIVQGFQTPKIFCQVFYFNDWLHLAKPGVLRLLTLATFI